jgi:hypothetical protein
MHAHTPDNNNDLSDLERRLSGWRPDSKGLDADAMVFAAGLAAGRRGRGRLLGPSLCGLLAALAVGLGVWGLTERAQRQALALHHPEPAPTPRAARQIDVAVVPDLLPSLLPDAYFNLRRQAEQDLGRRQASVEPDAPQPPGPPPPEPRILSVGQRPGLLD